MMALGLATADFLIPNNAGIEKRLDPVFDFAETRISIGNQVITTGDLPGDRTDDQIQTTA